MPSAVSFASGQIVRRRTRWHRTSAENPMSKDAGGKLNVRGRQLSMGSNLDVASDRQAEDPVYRK